MAKSKVHKRGPSNPRLNMTSLIDVTFLLIIFFMIISKIVSEESVELIPPDLEDPKTREIEEIRSLKVSIAPRAYSPEQRRPNHLNWAGEAEAVFVGNRRFSMDDMESVTNAIKAWKDSSMQGGIKEEDLQILLRADAALYYDSVQPVMAAITAAGVAVVHLVAYLPEKGPVREEELR